MKTILLCAVAIGLAMAAMSHPLHAADVRHGVVTELKPIENRGDDETKQVKTRRKIGKFLGKLGALGIMASDTGGSTGTVVAGSGLVERGASEAAAQIGGEGPTTRYMVKVRLDKGKVLAITQLREDLGDIKVGSRVTVKGSGGDARILAE